MKKYKIYAPVDYMSYLCCGYYEGEIEIDEDKIDDEDYLLDVIKDRCEFVVDDINIKNMGSISFIKKEEIV